eukprot:5740883-Prymnesium_polylepis.1
MLTAASTIGLAEPACRRSASAPGTSARPVSRRETSPGPKPPIMCVGAPGEAGKCAACRMNVFVPTTRTTSLCAPLAQATAAGGPVVPGLNQRAACTPDRRAGRDGAMHTRRSHHTNKRTKKSERAIEPPSERMRRANE